MPRRSPVSVPVPVEIIRVPLGGEGDLHVPQFSVVLGACIVPAARDDDENAKAARKSWKVLRSAGACVTLDGDPILLTDNADDVVMLPGEAMPFRATDEDPRVLTPRDEPVVIEAFLARGSKKVTAPAGWEVWVYVAR